MLKASRQNSFCPSPFIVSFFSKGWKVKHYIIHQAWKYHMITRSRRLRLWRAAATSSFSWVTRMWRLLTCRVQASDVAAGTFMCIQAINQVRFSPCVWRTQLKKIALWDDLTGGQSDTSANAHTCLTWTRGHLCCTSFYCLKEQTAFNLHVMAFVCLWL